MNTQRICAVVLFVALLTGVALTQGRQQPMRPGAPVRPPAPMAVEGMVQGRQYINPPTRPGQAPFSDAVMVGDTMYLSGRLGVDPRTGKIPADPMLELRIMLDGVRATLAQEGMVMDDLVSVQVFCTDLSLYERFNGVYRSYFTRAVPARAFIGTNQLLRGARFEIQAIASRVQ